MIRNETVFVLGAGASIPYGFPSGKNLVKEIIQNSRDSSSVISNFFGFELRTDFSNALEFSSAPSIDDFLEKRPEFMKIGKIAISSQLIDKENPAFISRETTGNWYELLWGCMEAKVDDFVNNKISFITFNYDRSLEFFIHRALISYYGIKKERAYEILAKIPIIHVHGMLGEFIEGSPNFRDYSPDLNIQNIEISSNMIHVFHEKSLDADKIKKQAESLIANAKTVCFLGFAYHPVNFKRIGIEAFKLQVKMVGSCYGMGNAEKKAVLSALDKLQLGEPGQDNLNFLRENFIPQ